MCIRMKILLILTLPLLADTGVKASIATRHRMKSAITSPVARSRHYSFPDEHVVQPLPKGMTLRHPIAAITPTQSPGTAIGTTWYDLQHFGSMGRMVDWSRHGSLDTMSIHFCWMHMPYPFLFARQYRYDNWNAATGSFGVETGLQSEDDFAGFVNIDVTEDGSAVVGGHNRESFDGFLDCQFYWDSAAGASSFNAQAQVPRALAQYGGPAGQEVIWPKFRYQEGAVDTVLHVLAIAAEVSAGE